MLITLTLFLDLRSYILWVRDAEGGQRRQIIAAETSSAAVLFHRLRPVNAGTIYLPVATRRV